MQALGGDLSAYLEGRVVRAHETGALAEFRKWIRRNRAVAVASAAAAVLALAGLGSTALVQAAGKRAASRNAYLAQITLAAARVDFDSLADARKRLEQCSPVFRNWEWDHLDLRTDTSLFALDHHTTVRSVTFAPSGRRLASVAEERVSIWDLDSRSLVFSLEGHREEVRALVFTGDGSGIVTGAWDNSLRLWNSETGDMVRAVEGTDVDSLALSPTGLHLAVGGLRGSVAIWDVDLTEPEILEGHGDRVRVVAFSRERDLLASASSDGWVRVWDVRRIEAPELEFEFEHSGEEVRTIAFSPDAMSLASGTVEGSVFLWALDRGELQREFADHRGEVLSVIFNPDGTRIASGSNDGRVRLWDPRRGDSVQEFDVQRRIRQIAFDPDGRRLAAACQDDVVRVWNVESGRLVCVLRGADQWIECLAFSPSGERIAAGSGDGYLRLWAGNTGDGFVSLPGHAGGVDSVAFESSGARILSAGEDGVLLCRNAQTGATQWKRELGSRVFSVALTVDGQTVMTGSEDRLLTLWDAASGKRLETRGASRSRGVRGGTPRRPTNRNGLFGRVGPRVGSFFREPARSAWAQCRRDVGQLEPERTAHRLGGRGRSGDGLGREIRAPAF